MGGIDHLPTIAMKIIFAICFLVLFFPGGNLVNAQEENNVRKGGIYILNITFSEELIEEYTAANNSRNIRKGYSISTILPDSLINSIKNLAEELCQERLKADVICIYKRTKKGEQVSTVGWGHVEGMPTNTFKGALASAKMNYYIKIDIMMQTGGKAIFFGKGKWSKIKPRVTAYIKIFDEEKNVVFTNKATLKDFSKLRSIESTQGLVNKTYSETLGPVDIYKIYELTMMKLLKEK
ncbi:MAG: hypothetical protein K8S00_13465 [Bacteroidales bacterium]|nr:hypothetical protein [Bacteroidales bacterium]